MAVLLVLLAVGLGAGATLRGGDGQDGPVASAQPARPADSGDDLRLPAGVGAGACVELVMSSVAPSVQAADCAAASHVVVAEAAARAQCPADTDVRYYRTRPSGAELFALCLDLNWRPGSCFDITEDRRDTRRVPCVPVPGRQVERYESTLPGTTDVDGCSDGGYPYAERRFVVCSVVL